jgi:hypothetical protein
LKKDGRLEVLELSVIAVDYEGKVRDTDQTAMTLELTADKHSRLRDTGVRTFSNLELPPGRYQLRIAARARGSGALGTEFHDIDVPDFASVPFGMSALLLTSVARHTVPSARLEAVKDFLPILPSTAREFRVGDEIVVFAEVYDRAATPHGVDVTATVRDRDERVMFQHHQENAVGGRDTAGGFGYVARVRLTDLSPGVYVLRVEATSRLTDGGRASRAVQFTVRR